MINTLKDTVWRRKNGGWILANPSDILVELNKHNSMWTGLIRPNTAPHLPPTKSLQEAMKKAEEFIRQRDSRHE